MELSLLQNNPPLVAYGIVDDQTIDLDNINNLLNSFNLCDRTYVYEGDVQSFCEDLQHLNSEDKM